jgi:hypothetical protein
MNEQMKLSAAIRLGATLRPQAHGKFFRMTNDGLCSCALGAAAEALGKQPSDTAHPYVRDVLNHTYSWFSHTLVMFEDRLITIGEAIMIMNDQLFLSREAIADQVEAWGY